jgi:pimeloyl-ACP methyl ester carboxylesterase
VRRAGWLVLGLLLALPPFSALSAIVATTAFLAEFLSDGRWRPLSAVTGRPAVRALAAPSGDPAPADLYARPSLRRPPGLVLVHGLSPHGKDDPRLRDAAALLARAGWAVAVPTVPGLTTLRLRPEDARAVAAAVRALDEAGYGPAAVLGISVGAGPALLAAAEPDTASRTAAVLALGGYASTVELLRFTLTGAYGWEGLAGRRAVQEAVIPAFVRANAELVEGTGRRLVDNRDPALVDRLVAELPPATRGLLDSLSPERVVGRIGAPLFLVHGRDDPAVPFTESLRLARAAERAGRRVRTVIVGAVGHVDPDARAGAGDLLRLWAAVYAFTVTSAGRAP